MSDVLERVSGIRQLPIFPLPLVLFPNELLPLHIFEPRYRKMLADAERGNNLFGIVTQPEDDPITERPAAGAIGCVAEIREKETQDVGRSNILTLGIVRFELLDYVDSDEPYAVGNVDFFVDDDEDAAQAEEAAEEVFQKFRRMAAAAFKLAGSRGTPPELTRADPESMSFLVAAAMNLDTKAKYELLKTRSTFDRLSRVNEMLSEVVNRIESHADIASIAKTNGHGGKLPDL
jgi:Lon protease-like protein